MTNLVLIFLMWHRDAPFQVPGYAARFEVFLEPSICCVDGVLAPGSSSRSLVDVLFQLLLQQRELHEQVISFADRGPGRANLQYMNIGQSSAQEGL